MENELIVICKKCHIFLTDDVIEVDNSVADYDIVKIKCPICNTIESFNLMKGRGYSMRDTYLNNFVLREILIE